MSSNQPAYPAYTQGRRNAISVPHGQTLDEYHREKDSQVQKPAPTWTLYPARVSMQQEEQQATAGAEAPDGWYAE
jgi:hypothetical protein